MTHFLIAKLFFIIFNFSYATICSETTSTSTSEPVSISCTKSNNTIFLQLNYSNVSGLSVFYLKDKWYAVWDLNENVPQINLPNNDDLPTGIIKIEKIDGIKSSRPCFVFSFEVSNEMSPIVRKNNKNWTINVVSQNLIKSTSYPNQLALKQQKNGRLLILSGANGSTLTLNLPTGEEVSVIPTNQIDTGLDAYDADYVIAYESAQGACLYLKSDAINIERNGQDLIYTPNFEPMMYSEKSTISESPHESPYLTFIRSGNFSPKTCEDIAALALYEQSQRPLLLMKQAWINLALCQGEEARHIVLLLANEIPDVTKSKLYLAILGFSQFLSQDYKESLKTLELLPNVPEINFWKSLCKIQLEEQTFFDKTTDLILQKYPPALTDYILIKLIPRLYETLQFDIIEAINKKVKPKSELAKETIEFYQAMHIFNFVDNNSGFNLLKTIAQKKDTTNTEFQTEASLETYLYKNSDAPPDKIIKELDVLRTQSRGNNLEIKICMKLIEQLDKKRDYASIVEIIQDLMQRFDKFKVALGLHQKLKEYIEKFFENKKNEISPIKIISIFRKYKSTIENDQDYLKFAENVATQFENLDLLDQAIDLLTELSKKTKDPEKCLSVKLKIGELYVQNKQPEKAIKFAEEMYTNLVEKNQERAAKLLSKAYLMKKDFDAAIKLLRAHMSKENKKTIADIYSQKEDYPQVINILKDYLLSLDDKKDDDLREAALIQLAAAYKLNRNFDTLKELHDSHIEFMKDRKSLKTFEMICRTKAEYLKNSQEVLDYINDADVLKEILTHS